MGESLQALLAIMIGYLLGSVLPADLLARWRGVDIRTVGDGNPGTVNAIKGLGWGLGLLAAVYDLAVGIVAIEIAGLLGVPAGVGYLAGIATIVGHRFPVFLHFRDGGQAMAASAGMLLYGVVIAVSSGWLSVADIALLLIVLAGAYAWMRSGSFAAVIMLPLLIAELLLAPADWQFVAFMAVVVGRIWFVQLPVARHAYTCRAVRPSQTSTR